MKHQLINYKGWSINIYYNASKENASFLTDELISAGCTENNLSSAYAMLSSGEYNQGFTFANMKTKELIVVICKSDSKGEFLDTLMHELYHCSSFITKSSNKRDPEYPAYVLGDLSQKVYKNIHSFLCNKCS